MSDLINRLRHVAWLAEEGSEVTDLAAAAKAEIVRLRAVLDAIASLHTPRCCDPTWCHPCDDEWPCATYLLIHPKEYK